MTESDRETYRHDFDVDGHFNWRTIRVNGLHFTTLAVLLHDGKAFYNGILYDEKDFIVTNKNPFEGLPK